MLSAFRKMRNIVITGYFLHAEHLISVNIYKSNVHFVYTMATKQSYTGRISCNVAIRKVQPKPNG